jgi:acetamidase/formamidase
VELEAGVCGTCRVSLLDGEVCGTAIECPMTTVVALDVVTDAPVPGIHATTPGGRITFGFDADLNAAMAQALTAMVTWLQNLYDLDRGTAAALASRVRTRAGESSRIGREAQHVPGQGW